MPRGKKSESKPKTNRRPSEKALKALAEINKIARKLKTEHPNAQWKNLIKEASKMYREKK